MSERQGEVRHAHPSRSRGVFVASTMTSPTRGVTVAEKSPHHHNDKKVGKSLKEKRNEKHAKKESKKGLLPE